MPDESRLQVRKNDAENTWGDVGNKTGNQAVPITNAQGSSGLPVEIKNLQTNNYETVGDIIYVGSENEDGEWQIDKVDKSAGSIVYASITNNVAVLTYSAAWTNRATLMYTIYSGS